MPIDDSAASFNNINYDLTNPKKIEDASNPLYLHLYLPWYFIEIIIKLWINILDVCLETVSLNTCIIDLYT